MMLSAWCLLLAAVPIVLLGEALLRLIKPLARFDLPAAIVGGLVVASGILIWNLSGASPLNISVRISQRFFTWLVTPDLSWKSTTTITIFMPFSTLFFTCVGLNASWVVAKKGSWQLLLYLAIASVLAVLQNVLGVAMARGMHQSALLGILCGSVTLTGGPSTAMSFAPDFQKAGFAAADVVGATAAMFGIVTASILGGALGGAIIRLLCLRSLDNPPTVTIQSRARNGFISRVTALPRFGWSLLLHIMVLLICVKIGAGISYFLIIHQWTFPVYMGALVTGILVRNILDAARLPVLKTEIIDGLGSVVLALFLAMAISSLDLLKLRHLAGPMLVILSAQVLLMLIFALAITFVAMGRDYDAAVMAAGHVGFGLGITPNAVASVDVLEQKFGPSPRGLLIVTIVGAFLIDIPNAFIINQYLHHYTH